MRTLTHSEKRTIRLGAAVIAICFLYFGGQRGWKYFGNQRAEYQKLVRQAEALKQEIRLYEDRSLAAKKMMETFRMDPAKLSHATVVADASAAIQKAAMGGGVQLGPVRETPARPSSRELASMQLEGIGSVSAVSGLLNRLESVGYPLIIESVQLTTDMRPGIVKVSLTILILDFDQWKQEGVPNA
ncbi:MAG: hypothetical protein NT154_34500 [Verrucomicrobia bacterium]|nr:hypothetical protein [Verrucomicrobiota bacterium]